MLILVDESVIQSKRKCVYVIEGKFVNLSQILSFQTKEFRSCVGVGSLLKCQGKVALDPLNCLSYYA